MVVLLLFPPEARKAPLQETLPQTGADGRRDLYGQVHLSVLVLRRDRVSYRRLMHCFFLEKAVAYSVGGKGSAI